MDDRQELEQDEMLGTVVDSALYRVRTCMPAEVTRVDLVRNTVDVQPLIMSRKKGKPPAALPIVRDVPIKYYGAGGFVITFQPAVGDVCDLTVCDRSIERWKQTGGMVDPAQRHRHKLDDALAYFGINDYGNAVPSIGAGMDIRTKDGATGVRVTAGAIEIRQGGTVIATMTASGVVFNVPVTIEGQEFFAHTHDNGSTGPVDQ